MPPPPDTHPPDEGPPAPGRDSPGASAEGVRRLAGAGVVGILVADFAGRVLDANAEFLAMLGYTRDDLAAGRLRWDAITPPEWRGVDAAIMRALEAVGEAKPVEKEYLHKDGRRVPVLVGGALLSRETTETVAFVVDLTRQRRAEAAAAAATDGQARLAAIVAGSEDAIVGKTLDGTITSWNPAAERLFGYAAEEIVGRSVLALIPPELRDEEPAILARLARGERVPPYETVRARKDGTRVPVSLTVSPVRDGDGRVIGASKILRDVTAQRAAAAERERLLARADGLQALTAALSRAVTPADVVAAAVREAGRGVGSHGGAFALLDPEATTFTLVAGPGITPEVEDTWVRWPNAGRLPGPEAVRTGRPAYSRTRAEYVARDPALAAVAEQLGIAAEATLPLVVGGRTLGVLTLLFAAPRAFGPEDDAFLRTVADQCAQALERARLFDAERRARAEAEAAALQLQEQAAELEAANEELQATAAELEERTEEAERRHAEAEAAGARAAAVLASIADAFYLLDRDWRFTYVNAAAEPLLQTTGAALLGRTLWEAFPGVAGSVFEGPYREAMATGRVTSAEAYFAPLGTWFDVRTYPWAGGLMVHFRDVGERKAAEAERERLLQQLRVERARLEEVFQRAPSFAVAYRGPSHVYEFVNEAYSALVGRRPVLGRPLDEAVPEAREQGFAGLLDRVFATGEPWVGRESPVWLERTPGAPRELRYVDMVLLPLTEADGTRSGVLAHGIDITEQVLARRDVERLLAESQRARAEAEAANAAKAQFLANMSHELRTPLNAIGGYAQLLDMGLHGPVTAEQRGALARVRAAQVRLLALINDVLNYAKLESGRVEYDLQPVDVADVIRDVAPLVEPQVRSKALAFDVRLPDGPCVVWADREKLGQVLMNLLSNAVKFTDSPDPRTGAPGRVAIDVTTRRPRVHAGNGHAGDGQAAPGDDPDGLAFLRVTDTGRGIPRERQDAIFEPFVQVRAGAGSAYAQPTEGTGLGLAISRDLARGMGGALRVRSAPGEGATFTVTLRRAGRSAAGAAGESPGPGSGGPA